MVLSSMAVGQHDIFMFAFFNTQIIWLFEFLCMNFMTIFLFLQENPVVIFIGFAMNLLIHIIEGEHHNSGIFHVRPSPLLCTFFGFSHWCSV